MKDKTKSLRISKKNLFVCFNVSTNIVNKMDIVHWENEKQHLQEHKMSVVTQQKNQIGMTAWQAQLQVDNHNCLSHFSIGIVDQISCISTDTTLLKYSVQGSHRSLPNPFIIQLPITPFLISNGTYPDKGSPWSRKQKKQGNWCLISKIHRYKVW